MLPMLSPHRLLTIALLGVLAALLMPLAHAQNGPLPLKNLLIEVRQVRADSSQAQGIDVGAQFPLQNSTRSSETRAQQQSLVLNGRAVRLMSGTSTPWALRQSYLRNGVIVVLPSTVWVQSGTGFMATPRWSGDGFVELELQAQQDTTPRGNTSTGVVQQNSSTLVLVPLQEWTTIAHSDTGQDSQQSGIGQYRTNQQQGSADLQVRITVP